MLRYLKLTASGKHKDVTKCRCFKNKEGLKLNSFIYFAGIEQNENAKQIVKSLFFYFFQENFQELLCLTQFYAISAGGTVSSNEE